MKNLMLATLFLCSSVAAQDFPGCTKPSILPPNCKDFKTSKDVDACTFAILVSDEAWHSWQTCAIAVIEKRRSDEMQQVLEAAKLARDSRLSFVRRAIQ